MLGKTCLAALALALLAGPMSAQTVYPDRIYYKFNEGSGQEVINFAYDASGPVAEPTWQIGNGGIWDLTSPQVGAAALDFAGQDRISSNYPTDLSTSFTIECWIRTNYTGTGIGRLWGDYSASTFRCYIAFYNTGANHLGGGLPTLNASAVTVTDQTWHHLALTWDATTGTLTSYVDGAIDQTATTPGAIGATGVNFQLGGVAGTSPIWNGAIDEFRFYTGVVDQQTLIANMMTELTPPVPLARFRASRTGGASPLVVNFQDFSATPAPGGITSWAWDVDGDGTTDYTTQNACHTYTVPGTYDVSLTITDANGNSDTLTRTSYVTAGPVDFVMGTCGNGDLFLGAPPPPAGWSEGYTVISFNNGGPVGFGPFFGLYPDLATFLLLLSPALPGNPFHFIEVGNTSIYPYTAISLPPGSFAPGTLIDATVIYLSGAGTLMADSGVARVIF